MKGNHCGCLGRKPCDVERHKKQHNAVQKKKKLKYQ